MLDGELSADDDEQLVGLGVGVPDKFALQPHDFHVVVVNAGQPVGLLVLGDGGERLMDVADAVGHVRSLFSWSRERRLRLQ